MGQPCRMTCHFAILEILKFLNYSYLYMYFAKIMDRKT